MIEVSVTEIFLFAWAVIATGFALKYIAETRQAMYIMQRILSDKKIRDEAVESWRKFEASSKESAQ